MLARYGYWVTAALLLIRFTLDGRERVVNGAQLPPEVTRKDARAGNDVVTLIRHQASAGRIRASIAHSSLWARRHITPGAGRTTSCANVVAGSGIFSTALAYRAVSQ
jgi:hypothetical protein